MPMSGGFCSFILMTNAIAPVALSQHKFLLATYFGRLPKWVYITRSDSVKVLEMAKRFFLLIGLTATSKTSSPS